MKEESLLLLSDLQKLINQVVLIDYTIIILGGERLSKQKVTLRIEEGKVELLKENITRIISQKPSDWQLWKVWLRKIRKKLRRCFRT